MDCTLYILGTVSRCNFRINSASCKLFTRLYSATSYQVLLLPQKINQQHQWRPFSTWLSRFLPRKDYFRKDCVEKKSYELVYFSPHVHYAVWGQFVSVASAVAIFALFFVSLPPTGSNPVSETPALFDNFTQLYIMLAAFGAFIAATSHVSRHVILRIYYNSTLNRFVAIAPHWAPFMVSKTTFTGGQAKLVAANSAVEHLRGEYSIPSGRYIITRTYFRSPYHYNVMLGHQVPEKSGDPQY